MHLSHTHTHSVAAHIYIVGSRFPRRRRRQTDRHLHIRRLSIWNWLSCWENCFAWLFFRQAPCWLTDFFSTAKSHYAPSAPRRLPLAAVRNSKFSLPLLRKKFRSARWREIDICSGERERCTLLPLAAIKGALEFERVTLCVCALSDILCFFSCSPASMNKKQSIKEALILGWRAAHQYFFASDVSCVCASCQRALCQLLKQICTAPLDNFAERAETEPYI